jgi:Tetratricopeptide repeat.
MSKALEIQKMEELNAIKGLIEKGEVEAAIYALDQFIESNPTCDEAYYLRGNAYRKQGNWQVAINNYLSAIELNPQSPALQAKKMMMDILNFYNKDMYNQ